MKYNIGIDAGDNIMNILIAHDNILPYTHKISFIIPDIDEYHYINIMAGDNILGEDNVSLLKLKLKTTEKVIYITLNFMFYYFHVMIETKSQTLYCNAIIYTYMTIINHVKEIDVNSLRLKFEVLQIIKLIRKKIKNTQIIIPNDEIIILDGKLTKIVNNIDIIVFQKLLDIKNNLKLKFFID